VIDACNAKDGNSYLFHFDVASRNVYQVNYDGYETCFGSPSSSVVVGDYSLIHWEEKCSYVSLSLISDGCVSGGSRFDTTFSYQATIADQCKEKDGVGYTWSCNDYGSIATLSYYNNTDCDYEPVNAIEYEAYGTNKCGEDFGDFAISCYVDVAVDGSDYVIPTSSPTSFPTIAPTVPTSSPTLG